MAMTMTLMVSYYYDYVFTHCKHWHAMSTLQKGFTLKFVGYSVSGCVNALIHVTHFI